jgi:diguanylate cyclase (GGDEF)-like protein/PAS domain S-box-containing protein
LFTIETQIWYLTDEHTYGAVNKAHAEFNGLKIEDMAFKNMYDFFPEDIVEVCRQSNIEVFTSRKPVHSEEWMPNASGERRLISILKSPKLCVDGTVEYVVCAAEDITESKQAQEAVHNLLTRLQLLAKHLPGFVYQYQIMPDGSSVFPYASSGIEAIYGLSPEEAARDAGRVFAVLYPDDLARVGASIQHSAGTLTPWHDSYRVNHPDGRLLWVEGHSTPTRQPDGSTLWHGYIHDITKRKQADDALQLAASVFSTAREGIMITDTDGAIIDVNEAFTQITGFGRDEVIGKNPRILSSGRHDHEFYAAMWRDLKVNGHWQGEVWNRRKNGEVYAVMQTIATVPDPEGNARHYVALFSDITSLKEHQNQLEHIAHYDALTRLPNRVLLADRLHQAMAQARRRETVLAVAFLDLDGFKAINDNHGHKAGDALLIALSARMKDSLREGDTLARIGGDEFVAVLVDLSSIEDSVPMLGRLLAAAAEPVHIGELTVQVSASLGVTFYPQAEDIEADQLQRQADQAMYQAKLAGKNRYHVFDAAHDRSVRGHHESIEHIRRALVEHEFTLYYQPKVNLRSGAVVGAEALIRWQHPQKGLLTPAAFLPVIEDHPLAIDIGEWVIETALTQMETWRAAGLELPVSVNVGAHQLQQPDFVQRLHALLLAHPTFRPGDLEIEVLETSALEDIARVSMVIGACRELGVAFALDDFGTGYSSLTYLKRLAVTVLKIDQSFVHDMLEDPDDLAILEGVLGLASAFRRVAIAEGVETMEHGKMLLQLGCDLAQGYGIARPMPADQMPAWAAAWITPPAWANCQQISHDNRPLLHAAVEHRAWIVAEEHYLKGERAALPPLDPHNCRFGLLLEAERRAGRGDQPGFSAIDTLHQQIHALADELCQLRTEGRAAESVARLGELYGLCNALIGQMKALEQ